MIGFRGRRTTPGVRRWWRCRREACATCTTRLIDRHLCCVRVYSPATRVSAMWTCARAHGVPNEFNYVKVFSRVSVCLCARMFRSTNKHKSLTTLATMSTIKWSAASRVHTIKLSSGNNCGVRVPALVIFTGAHLMTCRIMYPPRI